jgi:hypothetical protein
MVIRLAAVGVVLVAGGLINISGLGMITVPLGVVALLSSSPAPSDPLARADLPSPPGLRLR